jgi:hypothetical protein
MKEHWPGLTVRFDPNSGLFLNGKHVTVHGVGYHQGKGWTSQPEDVAADESTMREMGVTGIRLTHYQYGQRRRSALPYSSPPRRHLHSRRQYRPRRTNMNFDRCRGHRACCERHRSDWRAGNT